MSIGEKGMLSPFTVFTSIVTGGFFPLLGSFFAGLFLSHIYWNGVILTSIGGFLAHYVLAHTIHDLYHYKIEERHTLDKKMLKILLAVSSAILLSIAIYLAYYSGWPVLVFSIIGAVACLYAEGLLHHESQMAFGAMFLVIGSFYVQVGYFKDFDIGIKPWIELILLSLFAFFSQYGWLLFYRLDDYGWSKEVRNKSILIAKIGLLFLVAVFAMHVLY
ncbi:MAG: hypothetical protein FE047_01620 [Thermoplasmata archaeon]|nr:MAG: hypothetical protein FE047_01620 [Thermoplasmata archaeon]